MLSSRIAFFLCSEQKFLSCVFMITGGNTKAMLCLFRIVWSTIPTVFGRVNPPAYARLYFNYSEAIIKSCHISIKGWTIQQECNINFFNRLSPAWGSKLLRASVFPSDLDTEHCPTSSKAITVLSREAL